MVYLAPAQISGRSYLAPPDPPVEQPAASIPGALFLAPSSINGRSYLAPATVQATAPPAVTNAAGGGGPVREIRAYAKQFDDADRKKPPRAKKRARSARLLETQPLDLLAEQSAFSGPALTLPQLLAYRMPAAWSSANAMQLASLPRLAAVEEPVPVSTLDPVQQMLADLDAELEMELTLLLERNGLSRDI